MAAQLFGRTTAKRVPPGVEAGGTHRVPTHGEGRGVALATALLALVASFDVHPR